MKRTVRTKETQKAPEFLFRGNAVAAGGFLTRVGGNQQVWDSNTVSTHGESCLPMVGGVSRSVIEDPQPNYSEHINYGKVETFAEGRHDGDQTVTMLRAEVNRVRLVAKPSPEDEAPNVRSIALVAGQLALAVESVHPKKGQPHFRVKPSKPLEMALEITDTSGNVTTLPIELEFDDHLLTLTSMNDMDKAFKKNRKFFDNHVSRFGNKKKLVYGTHKMPRTPHGYVLGSIVRRIKVGDEQIRGNILTKKGFGTVQFGVMQTEEFSRRITMARVSMGSDPDAQIGLSAVETNGIWK